MPADSSSTTSPSQPSAASAMAINLPTFPEFDLQPRDTVPVRFEKYVKRLDNMFTAMNITRASQKKAMLLHYVGEETCDVFETLTVPEPPEGSDEYKTAVKALADHFEPQKCVDYHVYAFRQETQKSGENITEFYTRLQLLARKCQFADPELEIKRQIIQGTSSLRLRRKAIEQSLNLENLLKVARAIETADEQTTEMEQSSNPTQWAMVEIKQPTFSRKRILVVYQSLDCVTTGVVYVVEITHIKELALLKVKSV